jgi:adenosylcobinamide-GDP ribazoletransferase
MSHPPFLRDGFGGWRHWLEDLLTACAFLTRLPVAGFAQPERDAETDSLARAMRAFPLVGLVIGAIGWAVCSVALWLGLPAMAVALLTLLATVLATGALHEDGLADTADGFGGGSDPAAKLAIMRDSRSGAYGVLALIFSVFLRAAALASLAETASYGTVGCGAALIAAHAVSRAAMPLLMRFSEPARSDGLGAAAGRPDDAAAIWCLAIAIIVALLALGLGRGLAALLVTAALVALLGALARRQIGGYTGDVLGAAQQIGEMAMLLTAAA